MPIPWRKGWDAGKISVNTHQSCCTACTTCPQHPMRVAIRAQWWRAPPGTALLPLEWIAQTAPNSPCLCVHTSEAAEAINHSWLSQHAVSNGHCISKAHLTTARVWRNACTTTSHTVRASGWSREREMYNSSMSQVQDNMSGIKTAGFGINVRKAHWALATLRAA